MATETITGHFTCDNNYAVYVGNHDEVVKKVLPLVGDGVTNSQANDIWNGEDVTFDASTGDWFYIIAWSDDRDWQGLIGEFTGTTTIHTGNPDWEVYATGKDYDNNGRPPASEINEFITKANSDNAWKKPFIGPTNANTKDIYTGVPVGFKIAGIQDEANWVWYDSGKSTAKTPFIGHNHDEFLIFRIPVWKMAETLDPTIEVDPPKPVDPPAPAHDCCCGCAQTQPIICCPAPEKTTQFDVSISRVRIVENRTRDGKAEIMLTGYANGVSAVVPGMGSYITLFTNWGWRVMNKYVTSVSVKEDQTVTVPLMAEALQSITGGMRMGASQELKSLQLTAGKATEPQVLTIECYDGRANGSRESFIALEVEFIAFQK